MYPRIYGMLMASFASSPQDTRTAVNAIAAACGTSVFRVWGCFSALCKNGTVKFLVRSTGHSVAII